MASNKVLGCSSAANLFHSLSPCELLCSLKRFNCFFRAFVRLVIFPEIQHLSPHSNLEVINSWTHCDDCRAPATLRNVAGVKLFASLVVSVGQFFCIQHFNDRVSAWLRLVVSQRMRRHDANSLAKSLARASRTIEARARFAWSSATELLLCDETNAAVAAD
jgi:hypothetical protein